MSGASKDDFQILAIDGREVRISHPEKLYFSKQAQLSKIDIV